MQAVSAAARDLARGRLLLDEDVERIVADAETAAGRLRAAIGGLE